MNWHETIEFIRKEPSFQRLVGEAYLSADLKLNVERFKDSEEFKETLRLISSLNIPKTAKLLDVGAGNGISAIAFALAGYQVTALEPDESETIGHGAITELKEAYTLPGLNIEASFAEDMTLPDNYFDMVYARQCMHHASDLRQFMKSIYRVTKPGGLLLTVRDHVVSDEADKRAFLVKHPLHKFYGGENAFTLDEYKDAFIGAGFKIKEVLGPVSSVINYAPAGVERVKTVLRQKFGPWAANPLFINLGWQMLKYKLNTLPGKLYTFIAEK